MTATDGVVTATASLTVTSAALATLILSPSSASITAGASQTYTARGADQYGNDLGDLSGATAFAIGPDGTCTAATCTATTAGSHPVTATDGTRHRDCVADRHPAAAAQVSATSGSTQQAAPNQAFAGPLIATVAGTQSATRCPVQR